MMSSKVSTAAITATERSFHLLPLLLECLQLVKARILVDVVDPLGYSNGPPLMP